MDWELLIKNLGLVITGSAALYGAIMGYRNHKRLRTFDPENHLFKIKIEAYQAIVEEIAVLLDKVDDARILIKKAVTKEIQKTEAEWEELENTISKDIEDFRIKVAKYQFLTPKWVSNEIDGFYALVSDSSDPKSDEVIEVLEILTDRAYTISNAIVENMQKDLNLSELHSNLFLRTKLKKLRVKA